jgi:hypothetical protein
MDESTCTENWIAAYLEWAGIDGPPSEFRGFGRDAAGEAGADPSDAFAAAYLEWMEDVRAGLREYSRFGPAADVGQSRLANEAGAELETLRETVLLEALRTESDCIHMLRQTLDVGSTSAATVRFAIETIERADRLLEDERRAWQVLRALRQCDLSRVEGPTSRIDAEDNWSHALDGVIADMHSLTGRILALQAR